jgi:hypothetical protein
MLHFRQTANSQIIIIIIIIIITTTIIIITTTIRRRTCHRGMVRLLASRMVQGVDISEETGKLSYLTVGNK